MIQPQVSCISIFFFSSTISLQKLYFTFCSLLAVYLLDEVLQAIGSISKNVADAVDIIQQRLQHRSPTVKQKVQKKN